MKKLRKSKHSSKLVLTSVLAVITALALAGFGILSRPEFAQANIFDEDDPLWITNGTVFSIDQEGSTVYIGGNFNYVGPNTHTTARFDMTSGQIQGAPYEKVLGGVFATVPDGNGGYYIGGDIVSVAGQPYAGIAHILSNGTADPTFNPGVDNRVTAMALSGTTLYIGGFFSTVDSQTRNFIASIDTTTGTVTSWDPNSNGTISTLLVSGSTVYVGGNFTNIGGQARNSIAAIDNTGAATAWNPNSNGSVQTLQLSGSNIYAGGNFSTIGGQTRNGIAALDTTTGNATVWDPGSVGASIEELIVSGSLVYVAGSFATMGGVSRSNIAAVDITTGLATSFDPNADGGLEAMILSGSTLYVAGAITTIGGQGRNYVAALDTTTGNATSFYPQPDASIKSFAITGSTIYIAGIFTSVGGVTRQNAAAIDVTTGAATPFAITSDGGVNEMIVDNGTLYLAGFFSTINGVGRSGLASVNATTGSLNAFNPNPNGAVMSLAMSGNTLYFGGGFSMVGATTRNRMAAVDKTSGTLTGFDPDVDSSVDEIAINGSTVYISGGFAQLNGFTVPRNNIGAVDATTGSATSFDPNADSNVDALVFANNTLYVGGTFANIGGQSRSRIAALDLTGAATSFDPSADRPVQDLIFDASKQLVYVGGAFTTIGGQSRNRIAALDLTGAATSFDPDANPNLFGIGATALHLDGATLYAGGNFDGVSGTLRPSLARFTVPVVQFSSSTSQIGEASGAGQIQVTLSQADPDDVRVDYAVTGGTAQSGQDYSGLTSGTVTIPAGQTSGSIPFTVIDNTESNANKTIQVTLSNPINSSLGSPAVHTVTIVDDEGAAVTRIPGDTPEQQAVNISSRRFTTPGSADAGLLCRANLIVDCFVSGPLTNLLNAPMLLTGSGDLDDASLQELKRALGTSAAKTVYLIGGEQALSPNIVTSLQANGFVVKRVGGRNRFETAKLVAEEVATVNPSPTMRAFLSESELFIDALSIGAVASQVANDGIGDPILLVGRANPSLDQHTRDFLSAHTELTELALVGGTQAIHSSIDGQIDNAFPNLVSIYRLDGRTRYDTNLAIVNWFYSNPTVTVYVNGESANIPGSRVSAAAAGSGAGFYSALLASDYAGTRSAPLFLVRTNELPPQVRDYLVQHTSSVAQAVIVGSLSQVSQAVEDEIASLL